MQINIIIVFLIVTSIFTAAIAKDSNKSPKINKLIHRSIEISDHFNHAEYHKLLNTKPEDLIAYYGYKGEVHWTITEDGYNLTLYRITGNKTNPSPVGKRAVLLQHGLFNSAMGWLITRPKRSLAFILADLGFDVWLGNFRGSIYSRGHKKLDVNKKEFWEFSWHEMGVYDLPAKIDYILLKNGMSKIYFVGHSQGSTAAYVMLSERPEYNDKILQIFSFAPVVFLENIASVYKFIAYNINLLYKLTRQIGIYQFQPFNDKTTPATFNLCKNFLTAHFCKHIVFFFTGFSEDQFDKKNYPLFLRYYPAGGSVKQLVHFGQLVNSGRFQKFDYGSEKNMIKYNSSEPPCYKLENIRTPVTLYYGTKDPLVKKADIHKLYYLFSNPNVIVRIDGFNHIDFIWGKDVKTKVYDHFIPLMSNK